MDSTQINFKIIGQGPALLMLHGWQKNLQDLLPLAELLQSNATIHLLDLPGFGDSPIPKEDWDTAQYADRILIYLEQQKLTKVDLFGHSFGGRVAVRLASAYPSRVRSLILTATPGIPIQRSLAFKLRRTLISRLGKITKGIDKMVGTSLFTNHFAPRFGSTDYLQAGALRKILVKAVNENLTLDAQKIQAPTLLLWGDQDQETPLQIGQQFNKLIPRSDLLVLPNRGHHCFADVDGHLCAFYIKQFLKRLER